MDFTLKTYKRLLQAFLDAGYCVMTFEEYCEGKRAGRMLVLRHDVDLKAENSYATARIEKELGIKASYYFRVVSQSNRPEVIKSISALGHEIGYHYEDMSVCDGDVEKSYAHFIKWLEYFRGFYPVKTICMHGAPTSKFDSKDLWKTYDYKKLGIIGEPYLDTDFSQMFYITDTGRRWDGYKVSVRDRIPKYQDLWIANGWTYHCSRDIINALHSGIFPLKVMMTTHPQRWTDNIISWFFELLLQAFKNQIKRLLVR